MANESNLITVYEGVRLRGPTGPQGIQGVVGDEGPTAIRASGEIVYSPTWTLPAGYTYPVPYTPLKGAYIQVYTQTNRVCYTCCIPLSDGRILAMPTSDQNWNNVKVAHLLSIDSEGNVSVTLANMVFINGAFTPPTGYNWLLINGYYAYGNDVFMTAYTGWFQRIVVTGNTVTCTHITTRTGGTPTTGIDWIYTPLSDGRWMQILTQNGAPTYEYMTAPMEIVTFSNDGTAFVSATNYTTTCPHKHNNNTPPTAIRLLDGRIVLIGGYSADTGYTNAVSVGTVSGNNVSWTTYTPFPQNVAYAGSHLLPDGRILLVGTWTPATKGIIYVGTPTATDIIWDYYGEIDNTPLETSGICKFPNSNRIVVYGGDDGASAKTEFYTLTFEVPIQKT